MKIKVAIGLYSLVLALPAFSAVIDTTPAWDYLGGTGPFGVPSIGTVGQTFTAPSSQLDDFTLWLKPFDGTPPFYAYLMAWDEADSHASGTPLWQSGLQLGPSTAGFTAYTFSPAATLTPGAKYVVLLSTAGLFDYDDYTIARSWFGVITSGNENPYAGGEMVFYGGGWYWSLGYDSFDLLTTQTWSVMYRDAAFRANFSGTATPEPCAVVLALSGLCILAARRLRRPR